MRAKFFKAIFLILAVTLASGCWDAKELEDRDIVLTAIVDFNEGEYIFCAEIAAISSRIQNKQSEQSQTFPPSIIVSASGRTFAQARENIDRKLNKDVFLGAVQALLFTPRMAENGIEEYIYRFRQLPEFRKKVNVLVIKDEPHQFLEARPENASSVGFAIELSLRKLRSSGKTFYMSASDVLEKLVSQNDCYLLPMLSNEGGQITLAGAAVFDGPKMVGEIGCEEQHGIVYIASHHIEPDFSYAVPAGDTHVTIEAKMKGRRISAYYEENKIRFKLDFSFQGIELYPHTNAPVTDQMQLELESNLESMIMQEMAGALLTSRDKYGCDYFSLSEAFRIKYPDIYKTMDWKSEFKNASFDLSVSAAIDSEKTFDYNPEKKQ